MSRICFPGGYSFDLIDTHLAGSEESEAVLRLTTSLVVTSYREFTGHDMEAGSGEED